MGNSILGFGCGGGLYVVPLNHLIRGAITVKKLIVEIKSHGADPSLSPKVAHLTGLINAWTNSRYPKS
jgi:hypothetical protein